ncbi:MAG TPA: hypothetical protein VGD96_23180 [Bradyrhizobium sp.]
MTAPVFQSAIVINDRLPDRSESWRWVVAAGLLVIVLAIPFVLVDVPPVLDYPNHLARYFVLAHPDDPFLSQMFAPHWGILPNLGMDIIGASLLRVTDLHIGGRFLLALSLFAPIIGVAVYHRAVFGEWSWWTLASGLLAYNGAFFLGFANFLLSLGLALMAGAMWIVLRRRNMLLMQVTCGALAATIIFFCHIFGVAFFALLIGAHEAALLWRRRELGTLPARDVLAAAGPVAAALSPAVALYLLSPLNAESASVGEWAGSGKPWRIFAPFMTTSVELTLITGITVILLLILFRKRLELAPGLPLALRVLLVAFIVAPSSLKGGTFVDLRFALMIGLLLFAGIRPHLTVAEAGFAGLTVGILIVLRSAQVGASWIDHRHDLADLRAAIATIEPGTRVLAARGHPGYLTSVEPKRRALPGVYRLDGHLAALLLSERKAFWPLLFADPTQQPLIIKPPFDRIAQPGSEPVEWQWLAQEALPPAALRNARYLEHWRQDFDYVLLIDPPVAVQPHPGLSPLYRGNYAQLYRIDHQESQPRSPLTGPRDLRGAIADQGASTSPAPGRP